MRVFAQNVALLSLKWHVIARPPRSPTPTRTSRRPFHPRHPLFSKHRLTSHTRRLHNRGRRLLNNHRLHHRHSPHSPHSLNSPSNPSSLSNPSNPSNPFSQCNIHRLSSNNTSRMTEEGQRLAHLPARKNRRAAVAVAVAYQDS